MGVVTLMEMISLALHLMYALLMYVCYIPPLFLVSPSLGGICERYQTFAGGVRRTLNTGIVTLLNYGRRVPTGVSALTFAHEAGHNFGSQVLTIIHHLDGSVLDHLQLIWHSWVEFKHYFKVL